MKNRFLLPFTFSYLLFCFLLTTSNKSIQHIVGSSPFRYIFLGTVILIGIICFIRKNARFFYAGLLSGLIAGAVLVSFYQNILVDPLKKLAESDPIQVSAVIHSYPDIYDDSIRCEIKIDCKKSGISYPFPSFYANLYLPREESPEPGDSLQALVRFYVPSYFDGFDGTQYHASKGHFIACSLQKNEDTKQTQYQLIPCEKPSIRYYPKALAHHWKALLKAHFSDRESGFLISLLLGDKTFIDTADYLNLKKAGLSHIVAVSGMHLGILLYMVYRILGKRIGSFVGIPIILVFILMVGNSPSVIRAGIMSFAAIYAFLQETQFDYPTIVSASLLAQLLWNPYVIQSAGLQLSYLSTIGILLFCSPLTNFLSQPLYKIRSKNLRNLLGYFPSVAACSICAMVFTMPIMLMTFGYISILSPLSNLMASFLVSIAFTSTILFCLLPLLRGILIPIISLCIRGILKSAALCSGIHWSVLTIDNKYALIAIAAFFLIGLVLFFHKYTFPQFTFPVLCVILAISVRTYAVKLTETTTITIHPVGEGQLITVAAGYDSVSLIDCGSDARHRAADTLREYMLWNGFCEIDTIILTAVDKAHARALPDILREWPVRQIIIPDHLQNKEYINNLLEEIYSYDMTPIVWNKSGIQSISLSGLDAALIGGTNQKIGVYLNCNDQKLLVLHSFTQKMLSELLQQTDLHAETVVFSSAHLDKYQLLDEALEKIKPNTIIISESGDYYGSRINNIPVLTPYQSGEIRYKTQRLEG